MTAPLPRSQIRAAARTLRGVAHELRLAVLCQLLEGPRTVSQLQARTGATQSNLSQHLAKMRLLGLVDCERRGQEVVYRLAHPGYARLVEALQGIHGGCQAGPAPDSHAQEEP